MSLKKIIVNAVLLFLTVGCTSMRFNDFFMGYAVQMNDVVTQVNMGQFEQAKLQMPAFDSGHNAFNLSLLELGRLAFLMEDWRQSQQLFAQAYNEIEQQNQKAKLQISRGVENLSAVVSNDSALSYRIPAYEQTMLHSYQALNYLFQRDLEGALVEVRRANLVQETALKQYEKQLLDAKESLLAKGLDLQSLYSSYPNMDDTIGQIKNSFQNAFTFYLSGVLYEANGDLDSAYIDYKRAIDIFPDNLYLQKDVIRLANQLGRNEEKEKFEQKFGVVEQVSNAKQADVVVFFEQGLVNAKQELAVNLPIFTRHNDMRFFSFALPAYQQSSSMLTSVNISVGNQEFQAASIVNLLALANQSLKEQLPEMVTRQALRIVAKEEMRRKMQKEGGDVGNILAGLYSLASERADTRSWLTLPHDITMARFSLPAGSHQLEFNTGYQRIPMQITAQANKTLIVYVNNIGNKMTSHYVVL
ncbi:COG3014 family protein [Thalassotalea marina]|uniref:Tetratricopeptide repeat protein n=1 Tax=Thalassotalea marina TaxID=1673741 RepID=A0A919ENI5_9GAMM|nr:hypothetical protein [Thalassotalea marina]GHG02281.1 hypothetical protein GCM10017161_33970 [Thalassotalea marina]